jgi:hypothetical protein
MRAANAQGSRTLLIGVIDLVGSRRRGGPRQDKLSERTPSCGSQKRSFGRAYCHQGQRSSRIATVSVS